MGGARIRPGFILLLLSSMAVAGGDVSRDQGREEAARKAIEEFKQAVRDAKGVHEKALALQALSRSEAKDASMVPPFARYLMPLPQDINPLLPATALDTFGGFRGENTAALDLPRLLALQHREGAD